MSTIPSSNDRPAFFQEIDGSQASSGTVDDEILLLIDQTTADGSETEATLKELTSQGQADGLYGIGGPLASMYEATRANKGQNTRLFGIGLPLTGTKSSGTNTFTGPAEEAGVYAIGVDGEVVETVVDDEDTPAEIATKHAAAVNADPRLPITAEADTGEVTYTAKHDGVTGDQILITENPRSTDKIPAGVGTTIVAMSGGAGEPDMQDVIDLLPPDVVYDGLVLGVNTATALTDLEAEVLRRWGADVQLWSHVFSAIRGTHSEITTFGDARNSKHSSVVGSQSPTAPRRVAGAVAARHVGKHPVEPRKGLPLIGVKPPAQNFDPGERNAQLGAGMSTIVFDSSGFATVERLVTTHKTEGGVPTKVWKPIELLATLQANAISRKQRLSKWNSYAIVDDDSLELIEDPSLLITSPAKVREDVIAWWADRVAGGYGRDLEGYIERLEVFQDPEDAGWLNIVEMPKHPAGIVTVAARVRFLTQP